MPSPVPTGQTTSRRGAPQNETALRYDSSSLGIYPVGIEDEHTAHGASVDHQPHDAEFDCQCAEFAGSTTYTEPDSDRSGYRRRRGIDRQVPYLFLPRTEVECGVANVFAVGSPLGAAFAHFLITHKYIVGIKTITAIYAFESENANKSPALLFYVKPVETLVPRPADPTPAPNPGSGASLEMRAPTRNFLRVHKLRGGRDCCGVGCIYSARCARTLHRQERRCLETIGREVSVDGYTEDRCLDYRQRALVDGYTRQVF